MHLYLKGLSLKSNTEMSPSRQIRVSLCSASSLSSSSVMLNLGLKSGSASRARNLSRISWLSWSSRWRMAATSKAGFGHEDRRSDGGEVLESETSASEEAEEEDEEDSAEDRVRDEEVDGCGDKSLGQLAAAAAVRGRVVSTARTPSRVVLCTGRNMMECLWPLE